MGESVRGGLGARPLLGTCRRRWQAWTLAGVRALDLDEPVAHVSFYEADAFARFKARSGGEWAEARLPTEREWERAARATAFPGQAANFLDSGAPASPASAAVSSRCSRVAPANGRRPLRSGHQSLRGLSWLRAFAGPAHGYNGKFMDNQRVLRGGSCATPADHIVPAIATSGRPTPASSSPGDRLASSAPLTARSGHRRR